MALIDPRGRLFGRVHLFDASVAGLLLLVGSSTLYFAYTLSGLKIINIQDVEPSNVIVGQHERIRIRGSGFTQECVVKLSEHRLGHPVLLGQSFLEVPVPQSIPPGLYHPIVTGPRQSALSVRPISVAWKPHVSDVSPRSFPFWEETVIEITGERFEPECAVFAGETPIAPVEYIDSGHLRVRVRAHLLEPGRYTLKVVSPTGGETALDLPLFAIGQRDALLSFVILLDTGELRPEQLNVLERFGSGRPVALPQFVIFAHPLLLPERPPPPSPPRRFLFWNLNPEQRPDVQKMDFMRVPLVHLGCRGVAEYGDGKIRYSAEGLRSAENKPLQQGSRVKMVMDGVSFTGTIISPLVPGTEQPPEADS